MTEISEDIKRITNKMIEGEYGVALISQPEKPPYLAIMSDCISIEKTGENVFSFSKIFQVDANAPSFKFICLHLQHYGLSSLEWLEWHETELGGASGTEKGLSIRCSCLNRKLNKDFLILASGNIQILLLYSLYEESLNNDVFKSRIDKYLYDLMSSTSIRSQTPLERMGQAGPLLNLARP